MYYNVFTVRIITFLTFRVNNYRTLSTYLEKRLLIQKHRLKKNLKKIKRTIRYTILYFLIICIKKILLFFPDSWIFFFCESCARCFFHLVKRERVKTISHLEKAFGKTLSKDAIYSLAKNTFVNLGRNAAELLLWDTFSHQKLKDTIIAEGMEYLHEGLSKGKGVLIVTGHCGNWELIPAYLAAVGFEGSVIARNFHDDRINTLINSMRSTKGYGVIDRDDAPRKILKELHSNKLLGILADQDIKKLDSVFVTFFGHQAYTPTAPVLIALTAHCPLVPGFIIRDTNDKYKHKLIFHPPVTLVDNKKDPETITSNTQKWACVVEEHIRQYPDQWVWMHNRWKTTPEDIRN